MKIKPHFKSVMFLGKGTCAWSIATRAIYIEYSILCLEYLVDGDSVSFHRAPCFEAI